MELKRVVVTGLGALSPLGNNVAETWEAAKRGESGAAPITHFDASKFKTQFACEVKNFDPLLFFDRKELRKYDRFTQFALVATKESIADANIDVENVNLGPSVTKYELRPAVGVKVSRITHLADDLALALAAKDIRIEAPIPGKSLIGIEVPNQQIATVGFRDMVENAPNNDNPMEVPLGRSVTGDVKMADLTKMPHLLIAGATGSGKSVAINSFFGLSDRCTSGKYFVHRSRNVDEQTNGRKCRSAGLWR